MNPSRKRARSRSPSPGPPVIGGISISSSAAGVMAQRPEEDRAPLAPLVSNVNGQRDEDRDDDEHDDEDVKTLDEKHQQQLLLDVHRDSLLSQALEGRSSQSLMAHLLATRMSGNQSEASSRSGGPGPVPRPSSAHQVEDDVASDSDDTDASDRYIFHSRSCRFLFAYRPLPSSWRQGSYGRRRLVQHGRQRVPLVRHDGRAPARPLVAAPSERDDAAGRIRRPPPATQPAESPFAVSWRVDAGRQRFDRSGRPARRTRPRGPEQQQQQRPSPGHSALTRLDANPSHGPATLPSMRYDSAPTSTFRLLLIISQLICLTGFPRCRQDLSVGAHSAHSLGRQAHGLPWVPVRAVRHRGQVAQLTALAHVPPAPRHQHQGLARRADAGPL